jgi:hypothetical protein
MLEILKKYFFHSRGYIMSILEKLKDLVSALETESSPLPSETEESTIQEVSTIEPEAESTSTLQEEITPGEEEDAVEEFPDYLECTDEESLVISKKLAAIAKVKETIGDSLLEYERKKISLLNFVSKATSEMYEELNSLRLEYGLPAEGYTVQLPSSQSNKVSFSKD